MNLHTINTGLFKLDGGAMFGVVPKSIWQRTNPADANNLCSWAMRSLLIEDGDRLILVDNGIGDKQDAKFLSHYHLHGDDTLDKSLAAACMNGTIVTTAARSTHDLTPMHNEALTLSAIFMLLPILTNQGRESHGKILSEIAKVVDEGYLKPMVDPHVFNLATASEAHALLESGKAKGKVVISIP